MSSITFLCDDNLIIVRVLTQAVQGRDHLGLETNLSVYRLWVSALPAAFPRDGSQERHCLQIAAEDIMQRPLLTWTSIIVSYAAYTGCYIILYRTWWEDIWLARKLYLITPVHFNLLLRQIWIFFYTRARF